jgi:hypothetical protein
MVKIITRRWADIGLTVVVLVTMIGWFYWDRMIEEPRRFMSRSLKGVWEIQPPQQQLSFGAPWQRYAFISENSLELRYSVCCDDVLEPEGNWIYDVIADDQICIQSGAYIRSTPPPCVINRVVIESDTIRLIDINGMLLPTLLKRCHVPKELISAVC